MPVHASFARGSRALLGLTLTALIIVATAVAFQRTAAATERPAASRATAHLAGAVRKPPIRWLARHQAATRKKPTTRIVAPRPGATRKRVARPVVQPRIPAALTPNDPLWASSWSLAKVNAQDAWKLSTGTAETIVAVLDTGVDLGHPDLQGALVPGYDFVNRDEDPSDDHGHGTMVAGIIAARGNNSIGGVGVCSRCSIMPVKVIAGNGTGDAANVAAGIVWAADHGARVINLSFVLSGPDDGVAQALAYARDRGVVVVAAAGNAGNSDEAYPAAYPGVVSVTGTDASDAPYEWATHGSWVKLAAPGCSQTTALNATYGDFCGTSSATAFVSGLAGLARSFAADRGVEGIEQALAANAVPVGDIASGGRVNAAGMLGALRPVAPVAAQPQPGASRPAESFTAGL